MKSELRIRPPDRRLLLGYGPGLMLIVGFMLMALLVPTIAPEQTVASSGAGTGGTSTQNLGAASGLPASGGSGVSGTGGTSGSATPAGTTSDGAGGSSGGSTPSGTSGGSSAAPAKVSQCTGPQVSGDPYSPPCISFSGNNGGATTRGVTGSTITVSLRIPADNISSVDAAIQQISGKYNSAAFSDSEADILRTTEDLVTYFNEHFQFYGRKMVLKTFKGQGTLTAEITDGGQAQANADALTAANSIGAFADISALSQPYSQALSSQHVINIGAPYMSEQYFEQNAPYAWSFFPDCTDLAAEGAAIATRQLIDQKVTWAGTGVADGQTRRFAVLAPDNPVYQQCASIVTTAMKDSGHPVTANLSYTLDLSQLSQEASSIEQQIVNDKITTVLCGCDPITLIYLTSDLDNAHYEPEFSNIGAAFTDEDLLAQLFDQSAWAHAAGVTNNANIPPYGSSLGYFAAKSVDPNNPPAHEVDTIYEDIYMLAIGIEMAGPDLTPANFERGMFSYKGGNGEYGPWTFNVDGTGSFTPQHEFRYEWWDPAAESSFDQEQGTWETGTTWYTAGSVPSGFAPVFPHGPQ